MAPRQGGGGGERKEGGAWVKKTGTAATTEGADEESEKPKRNEKGRGRQSGKGGRREPRENTTEEGATEGRSRGRGKGGRNGARRGQAQEQVATADNHDDDEDEESQTMGNALLTLLKANTPKVTKYTKGELLSIARLPASNIKPPNLCPLIDAENKDSQLLIRVAGRTGGAEEEGADPAARKERREKRPDRKAERGSEENEVPEKTKQSTTATPPVGASSPSTPNRGPARTPEAPQGKATAVGTKSSPVEEDTTQASRGLEKWFPGKTLEKGSTGTTPPVTPATGSVGGLSASVTSATGSTPGSTTAPTPSSMTSPSGSQGFPASLLQQQQAAQQSQAAQAQAQALQAQAYMSALQMAAQQRGGGWPWGSYNPYAGFPPYGNPYAGYPSGMDYSGRQAGAFDGLGSTAQAKLFSQMGAYGNLGGANQGATRKAAMPKSQGAPNSTGGTARPKKSAAPETAPTPLEALPKSSLAPATEPPLAKDTAGDNKPEDEDEAGCSQS